MTLLEPVRCRGCRRAFAVGTGQPTHTVFCDVICGTLPPAGDNEERDDLIEALARMRGWNPTQVAVEFDLTRQRASQIIRDRIAS